MNTVEVIRINEQIYIELYHGSIRIQLIGNESLHSNYLVNDGYYHLIQMEYNVTGYLYLNVDNKSIRKQITNKLLFDKPLLLLIGQNPTFKHPFQVREREYENERNYCPSKKKNEILIFLNKFR
jgi:hypothetical protein